jgi:hypothetical protein
MKVRLTVAVTAMALLVAAFASIASAASDTTLSGKLTSFSYSASKKTGKLHIVSSSGKKTTITLNRSSGCGVSFGQSGDEVPCASYATGKYNGRMVRVAAKKYSDGHYTASIVSADLSR